MDECENCGSDNVTQESDPQTGRAWEVCGDCGSESYDESER